MKISMREFRALQKRRGVDPGGSGYFDLKEKNEVYRETAVSGLREKHPDPPGPPGSTPLPFVWQVSAPIKTGRGLNDRLHRMVRAEKNAELRTKAHQLSFTALSPRTWSKDRIALVRPWWVRLVRVSPGTCELDDDNLRGSLKAVRDGVADRLHVDDGDKHAVRFLYAQERGPWAVRIEFHLTRPETDDE